MATSWRSQQGEGRYALQFETDNKEKYKLVEKAAQMAVDGENSNDVSNRKVVQYCIRTTPAGYNDELLRMNGLLMSGCRVVMVNDYVVDVIGKNVIYGHEYILEKEFFTNMVEIPKSGIGDLSDGYHTFNELYHHRAILFSVICNMMPEKAWKSKLHDTGDMYDGMFIVGIETPKGQATYHYNIDPYWEMFKVKELEKAPKWDGHTPKEAIERIALLK